MPCIWPYTFQSIQVWLLFGTVHVQCLETWLLIGTCLLIGTKEYGPVRDILDGILPEVPIYEGFWKEADREWLSLLLRLKSLIAYALETSTGYAGRRPLPWLACNVARAWLTVTVSCHPSHKLECLLAPYPHASPIRFEKTNLPFLFCGLLMFFCAFESRRVFSIIFSSTNFLCNFEQNHPSISNAAFRAKLRLKTKNAILNSSGYCIE